jgi:hypothetical protein
MHSVRVTAAKSSGQIIEINVLMARTLTARRKRLVNAPT